jgi:hypothetical protein
MDMELISQIFEVCIIPLLGVLTAYLVKFINVKSSELAASRKNELEKKYIEMLNDTITDCVIATTQTYVDSLKKEGSFNIEAQKVAFAMTYEAVVRLLTDEATEYLNAAVGDLNLYITQKIEAEVNLNKTIVAE